MIPIRFHDPPAVEATPPLLCHGERTGPTGLVRATEIRPAGAIGAAAGDGTCP